MMDESDTLHAKALAWWSTAVKDSVMDGEGDIPPVPLDALAHLIRNSGGEPDESEALALLDEIAGLRAQLAEVTAERDALRERLAEIDGRPTGDYWQCDCGMGHVDAHPGMVCRQDLPHVRGECGRVYRPEAREGGGVEG